MDEGCGEREDERDSREKGGRLLVCCVQLRVLVCKLPPKLFNYAVNLYCINTCRV